MSPSGTSRILAVVFGCLSSIGYAQDLQIDTYGYGETTGIGLVSENDPWIYAHGRFRPTVEASLGDRLLVSTSFSLTARYHSSQEFPWMDCSPNQTCFLPSRIGTATTLFEMERLFVDYYGETIDLRIGRQALFWGSGVIWNPTNPFQQLLAFSPWENRSGVDALRLNWALPWELDSTWIISLNNDAKLAKGVLRLQKQFTDLDVAMVNAVSLEEGREAAFVGFDLKGNLGATYWIEGALHLHPTLYTELVVGADYSFNVLDGWILSAQYNFNSVEETEQLALRLTDPFLPLNGDKHSFILSSGFNFLDDWSIQNLLLAAPVEGTGAIMNTISWAGADAFSAQLTWIQPFALGDKEETALPGGGAALGSGSSQALLMGWGRWSF